MTPSSVWTSRWCGHAGLVRTAFRQKSSTFWSTLVHMELVWNFNAPRRHHGSCGVGAIIRSDGATAIAGAVAAAGAGATCGSSEWGMERSLPHGALPSDGLGGAPRAADQQPLWALLPTPIKERAGGPIIPYPLVIIMGWPRRDPYGGPLPNLVIGIIYYEISLNAFNPFLPHPACCNGVFWRYERTCLLCIIFCCTGCASVPGPLEHSASGLLLLHSLSTIFYLQYLYGLIFSCTVISDNSRYYFLLDPNPCLPMFYL